MHKRHHLCSKRKKESKKYLNDSCESPHKYRQTDHYYFVSLNPVLSRMRVHERASHVQNGIHKLKIAGVNMQRPREGGGGGGLLGARARFRREIS